jgi:MATE family multidrug resistance protein
MTSSAQDIVEGSVVERAPATLSWRQELAAQRRLALPVVFVQVGMMTLNVIDVVMVGHVASGATEQIAAVAVGGLCAWLPMSFGMGVLMALDPLVSQASGAGDEEGIARSMQRGLVLAMLLTVPLVIPLLFAGPILRALGQPPDVIPLARGFVLCAIPGVPAFFLFVLLRQSLQALHRMRPIVIAIVLGNLANVVLDFGFIHGRLGLPALGAVGCSIATTLCRWFMFLSLLSMSWPVVRGYVRPWRPAVLQAAPLLRMLRVGAPIGLQLLLEIGAFSVVTVTMGRLGATQMAGHQVALNLASLSFMVPVGISAAASIRVGHAVGRGDPAATRRAAGVAIAAGASVMIVFALLFALLPRTLAGLYSREPGVIDVAAMLLPLAAIFQVFDGTQIVCGGVLRGSGDTRTPMIVYLLGYWVFGLPLSLWLGLKLGYGPAGLWWGLVASLALVAVILVVRVRTRLSRVITRLTLEH